MDGIEVLISEETLERHIHPSERSVLSQGQLSTLSTEEGASKINALSRAVAENAVATLKGMVPEGFKVSEVSLNIKIGGKAFGIEISGTGTVKMVPDGN